MSAKRSFLCAVLCVIALLACLVPPAAPVAAAGLPYAVNLTLDRTSQVVSDTLGQGEGVTATITVVDSAGAPVLYTGTIKLDLSATQLIYDAQGSPMWAAGSVPVSFQQEPRKSVRITTPQAGDHIVTVRAETGELVAARSPVTFTPAAPIRVDFGRRSTDVPVATPYAQVTGRLLDQYGNQVKQAGLSIQVTPMRGEMPTNDIQVNGAAGAHTWQTAADGTVALNLSASMAFVGSTYSLSAMPAAGGPTSTHTVRVVNSVPQTAALTFWSIAGGWPMPASAVKAGESVLIKIKLSDGFGIGVAGYADALSLGFGEGQWTLDATGATRLHPGDRVPVQDDGSGNYSVTVVPVAAGTLPVNVKLDVNGTPVTAASTFTVRAGQPARVTMREARPVGGTPELCMPALTRPITLQLTDAYGNETVSTTPVNLLLSSDQTQFQFRSAPDAMPATQYSIPAGVGSATRYALALPGTAGSAAIADADGHLTGLTFNYQTEACVSVQQPTAPAVVGQEVEVSVVAKGLKGLKGWSADVRVDPKLADLTLVRTMAIYPITYAPRAVGRVPGLAYDDSSLLYPTQPGADGELTLFVVDLIPKVTGRITLQLSAVNLLGAAGVQPAGREDLTLDVLAAPPLPMQPVIDNATKLPNSRSVTLQFRQPPAPQTAYIIYRHAGLGGFTIAPELQVGTTITGQFTDETVPQDGDYTWEATSMNLSQVQGLVSVPQMMTVDSVPPKLSVTGASTVTSPNYSFRVATDGLLPLTVNGTPVYPGADGMVWWQLQRGGTNGLTVRAMDAAGNYTERTLMVTYVNVRPSGPSRTWTTTAEFQTGTLTGLSAAGDELKLAAGARTGSWIAQQDSGGARTRWTQLTWVGTTVAGGSVTIKTRTAEDPAQLSSAAWAPLGANGTVASPPGRYIEVKVEIAGNVLTGRAPVVQSVTVNGVTSTR